MRIFIIALILVAGYIVGAFIADPVDNRLESQRVKSGGYLSSQTTVKQFDAQNRPAWEENYIRVKQIWSASPTSTPVVVSVIVTHYSCSEEEGTADCRTFSGTQAGPGTIASNDYPIGTPMIIEQKHFTVTDRGGGLRPGQIDMWVEDRETAFKLGVKRTTATLEVK